MRFKELRDRDGNSLAQGLHPAIAVIAANASVRARFGLEGLTAIITTLAERGYQVIYLTEDPDVLSWAMGLPSEAGAATPVAAYLAPELALAAN